MFEEILPKRAVEIVETLSSLLESFYLAGGTGLGLQLGHRKSDDLDFFSAKMFNTDAMLSLISPDKVILTALGTVHCEIKGIRVSFLFYEVPLIHPPIPWHGIKLAHFQDIVAEKLKTISQRGSKKDFIDLYAVLKMKYSLPEVCGIFKQRFKTSDINYYHVVKSLVFFEDADKEPSPVMVLPGEEWRWENIKSYFVDNINLFEREFGLSM